MFLTLFLSWPQASLEVRDGFVVHRSDTFDRTARYLKSLDDALRARLRAATCDEVLGWADAASYADILESIDVNPKLWPLRLVWKCMLLHIPGCKLEYLQPILDAGYDTPAKLITALKAHDAANEKQPLLTKVLDPNAPRGRAADAKRIATFLTHRDYTPAPPKPPQPRPKEA